ncbi:MAG: hypothetical protein GX251_10020 [Firmicutes bacterium]|nr:hypothetical protein [Bacillota bacterium]
MVRCPFCNQPMVSMEMEADAPFADLYRCGACQVQQAVHWGHGERILVAEQDQEPGYAPQTDAEPDE